MKSSCKSAFVVALLYLVGCGSATKPSQNVRFMRLLGISFVDVSLSGKPLPAGAIEIGHSLGVEVGALVFETGINYTRIWTLVGPDGSSVEFVRESGVLMSSQIGWGDRVVAPAPPGTYKVVCRLEQSKAGQQDTSSVSAEFLTIPSQ